MKKNLKIGSKITFLDSVDSTNNYAANLILSKNIQFGQVIMSDFQHQGRGQRGSNWNSESGKNLLFSVYLEFDNLSVEKQALILKYAALCVQQSLKVLGMHAQIKWPNDIYVGNKKICGVLIENQLVGKMIKNSVVGIGLNVNQTDFQHLKATSLKNELHIEQNRIEVLDKILSTMNYYFDFIQFEQDFIDQRYHENILGLGKLRKYRSTEHGEFSGTIEKVNSNGQLEILSNGKLLTFNHKEVEFLDL